jgi:predicted oxidoreductase (fatty acid repression mutant protein)
MEVIESIKKRRSVRDFSPKPVPRETLLKIFEAAANSPSSGNGQPWEVFVATGETLEPGTLQEKPRRQRRTGVQTRSHNGTDESHQGGTPEAAGA